MLSLIDDALLALGGIGAVAAQDATPSTDSAGASDLSLTLTDAGVEGLPAETTAGWHTVSFTNSTTPSGDPFEDAWGIDFIQLPEGMTIDDVNAAISAMMSEGGGGEGEGDSTEGMDMASPESMEGMDMGSPEAGAAPENPFAFLYNTYLAGGPGAAGTLATPARIRQTIEPSSRGRIPLTSVTFSGQTICRRRVRPR